MKGVELEIDPTATDPYARCLDPMRLRNNNPYPVMVTTRLHYWGEGPGSFCQTDWKREETVRLEERDTVGYTSYLGCSHYTHSGSPCVERRSWAIVRVERPVSSPEFDGNGAAEEGDFDFAQSDSAAPTAMYFFVAKRPWDKLEIEFEEIVVDGFRLPFWQVGVLDGDQGYWVQLGSYIDGSTATLSYKFRTGNHVPAGEVVLGYYPNRKISKAVRFAHVKLEPWAQTSGSTEMAIKS